jgi:hypothetical protein
MLTALANGTVAHSVACRLRASRLISICTAVEGKTKVRPIAVGEAWTRLAGTLALDRCLAALQQRFGEVQLALTQGGAEKGIHLARAAMRRGETCVTLDAKNAFNSLKRQAIANTLQADPILAPLVPLFRTLYGAWSILRRPSGETIWSKSGVRQGDSAGPALFAATTFPALCRVRAAFPSVRIVAYLDDVTLLSADGEALVGASKALASEFRALGLELAAEKCHVCGPLANPVAAACGFRPVTIIRVLGAFLGPDSTTDLQSAELLATASKQSTLLKRLACLSDEEAFALLRVCVVPRFVFAARVHPPEVSSAAVKAFDSSVRAELERLLNTPIPDGSLACALSGLAIADGGLGVRRIAPMAAEAYAASLGGMAAESQAVRQHAQDLATIARIDADERHRTIRAANKKTHARLVLAAPTTNTPPWGSGRFAVQLQLRLGISPLSAQDVASLACDCGVVCSKADFIAHVAGCSVRPGYNASGRATDMNEAVISFLRSHRASCAPERSPPVAPDGSILADLLVHLPWPGPDPSAPNVVVVDWRVFSPLAPSRPTAKDAANKVGRGKPK